MKGAVAEILSARLEHRPADEMFFRNPSYQDRSHPPIPDNQSMKTRIILALTIAITGFNLNAQVIPPVTPVNIKGHTYAEWSEKWWQYAYSLPTTKNPLFDTADASVGQKGDVWFIGGSFDGLPKTRTATVPKGKLLFIAIITGAFDNTDCSDSGQRISDGSSVSDLRAAVQPYVDSATNVSCTIDGVDVPGLTDAVNSDYRVQSSSSNGFSYSLPGSNNILNFDGLSCWADTNGAPIKVDANTYHPVADGIYVMVGPLSPGTHTIHAHADAISGGSPFAQDVTYTITVTH
jgi:hypothetical protein